MPTLGLRSTAWPGTIRIPIGAGLDLAKGKGGGASNPAASVAAQVLQLEVEFETGGISAAVAPWGRPRFPWVFALVTLAVSFGVVFLVRKLKR